MSQFRPGNFQVLPLVIKNLIIINGLVFLLQYILEKQGLETQVLNLFALHNFESPLFKPHQLITHMFMHGDFGHIFFNMFALWMFGSILENYWGPKRFLIFYLVCGLGAAVIHLGFLAYEYHSFLSEAYRFQENPTAQNFMDFYHSQLKGNLYSYSQEARQTADNWMATPSQDYIYKERAFSVINTNIARMNFEPTLGASGAVFGCLAAFGYLFPNSYIYLYFLFPIKVKWFVLGYAAIEFITAIQNSAGDNVAHWAHLGGALVGFLMVYYWNKTNRKTFY